MADAPHYPYASLADIRRMEAQLRVHHPEASLALSCGHGKHGVRSPWLVEAQRQRAAALEAQGKPLPKGATSVHMYMGEAIPPAMLERFAAYSDEELFALKYTRHPLTAAEAEHWEGLRAADASNGDIPRADKRHFVLLLDQCTPVLADLDGDNPTHALYAMLERAVTAHGGWFAPSMSKGFHSVVIVDAEFRQAFAAAGPREDLRLPSDRKDCKAAGDVLKGNTVAYRVERGRPLEFHQLQEVVEACLDPARLPRDRVARAVAAATSKTAGWEREPRKQSRRTARFLRLLPAVGRSMALAGVVATDSAWAEAVAVLWRRYRAIRPDGMLTQEEVEAALTAAAARTLASLELGSRDRPVFAMVERIQDEVGEHLYVDRSVAPTDRDLQMAHWFDAEEQEWLEAPFSAADAEGRRTASRRFRTDVIRPAVFATLDDLGIKVPDVASVHRMECQVWDEIAARRPIHAATAFDYERAADIDPATGKAVDPELVRYFGVGRGKALRVSLLPEHKDAPVAVVDNAAEYFVKRRLTYPAEAYEAAPNKRHDYKECASDILGGDHDLADEFLRVIVARMLPRHFRPAQWMVLMGGESSGKSSLLGGVAAALGEYATVDAEYELITRNTKERATTSGRLMGDRAALMKYVLVGFEEVTSAPADAAYLKKHAENRRQKGGGMYKSNVDVYVDALFVALANDNMRFSETEGLGRRTWVFKCPNTYASNPDINVPGIEEKFCQQAPSIMRLLMTRLEALIRLKHATADLHAMPAPHARVREWTQDMLASKDSVRGTFLACFVSQSKALALRRSYDHTCKDNPEQDTSLLPLGQHARKIPVIRGRMGGGFNEDGDCGVTPVMGALCEGNGVDLSAKAMTGRALQFPGYPTPTGRNKDLYDLVPTIRLVQVIRDAKPDMKSGEAMFKAIFSDPDEAWNEYGDAFRNVWNGGDPNYIASIRSKHEDPPHE